MSIYIQTHTDVCMFLHTAYSHTLFFVSFFGCILGQKIWLTSQSFCALQTSLCRFLVEEAQGQEEAMSADTRRFLVHELLFQVPVVESVVQGL